MRHWRVAAAIVGAVMVGFGAWAIQVTTMPRHTIYIDAGGCRTPVTVIDPDLDQPLGSVVMLHGLSANRRVMNYLGDQLAFDGGLRIYALDLAGHGDNETRFTFEKAKDCAGAAVAKLVESRAINPETSVYVGHSMGASIAIDLADTEPLAGTVAISPAPMVLPKRMPSNLLVFTGQFDLSVLKEAANRLLQAAGGNRTAVADFMQKRAFLLDSVRWASHTTQLHNQQVEEDARDWIHNSLEAAAGDEDGVVDWSQRANWTAEQAQTTPKTALQTVWYAAIRNGALWGALGLLLIYPLLLSVGTRFSSVREEESSPATSRLGLIVIEWAVFSFASVLILILIEPMNFVHLYTGGYLASLMLVVGILVGAANQRLFRERFQWNGRVALMAAILALAIMFSMGGWLNWEIDDAWMNAPRWLRFLGVLPAAWLFFYSEEILLGPVGKGRRRAKRFAVFLALRALLFSACAFAVFHLASGQVLILLLGIPLFLLTVLTRLGSDSLRARTGSATAAALFGAILAAWFAAAVFPLS